MVHDGRLTTYDHLSHDRPPSSRCPCCACRCCYGRACAHVIMPSLSLVTSRHHPCAPHLRTLYHVYRTDRKIYSESMRRNPDHAPVLATLISILPRGCDAQPSSWPPMLNSSWRITTRCARPDTTLITIREVHLHSFLTTKLLRIMIVTHDHGHCGKPPCPLCLRLSAAIVPTQPKIQPN